MGHAKTEKQRKFELQSKGNVFARTHHNSLVIKVMSQNYDKIIRFTQGEATLQVLEDNLNRLK